MPADHDDELAELLEQFLQAYRSGSEPDVDAWASQYPTHADEIRELFPAAAALEVVKDRTSPMEESRVVPLAMPTRIGDYILRRSIGRGGMGEVFEAEHAMLDRRAALKMLRLQTNDEDTAGARFLREARLAARLDHPHIAPVYDAGIHQGQPWFAMQLVTGENLEDLLRMLLQGEPLEVEAASPLAVLTQRTRRQRSDPHASVRHHTRDRAELCAELPASYYLDVARIGAEVALALEHAHTEGILHRDIKPGNIVIEESGRARVVDFGLARAEDSETLTSTGVAPGTMAYMAPEQWSGTTSPQSDLYSLGVTLYELLALERAYPGRKYSALIRAILEGKATPLGEANPHAPPELIRIVQRAMALSPAARYQSAQEMYADLSAYITGQRVQHPPIAFHEQLMLTALGLIILVLMLYLAFAPPPPFPGPPRVRAGVAESSDARAEESDPLEGRSGE